jgi:methylglutaconyl-CoA hydratase
VAWSSLDEVQEYTARTIAGLRGSDEGREGFAAFFEKRKPNWDVES